MHLISLAKKAANKLVRKSQWFQYYWSGATKFWFHNQFELDIINLGSSSGVHAFDYSGMNVKGANWALAPQSLVHDFNILKNYFSYIRENGIVLISLCPFSCLVSQYTKKQNLKYYTFLHPATIEQFEDSERSKAIIFKTSPFTTQPIFCLKEMAKYYARRIKSKIPYNRHINFESSSKDIIDNWMRQFGIKDLARPVSPTHKKDMFLRRQTLNEMIDFCKSRSLRPVIVIPPIHPSLTSKFPQEFKKNYINEFIKDIDIPIYDYMVDKRLADDSFFTTPLLMSPKGAGKLTSTIISQLQTQHLLN